MCEVTLNSTKVMQITWPKSKEIVEPQIFTLLVLIEQVNGTLANHSLGRILSIMG
jgi:hypothetical protein